MVLLRNGDYIFYVACFCLIVLCVMAQAIYSSKNCKGNFRRYSSDDLKAFRYFLRAQHLEWRIREVLADLNIHRSNCKTRGKRGGNMDKRLKGPNKIGVLVRKNGSGYRVRIRNKEKKLKKVACVDHRYIIPRILLANVRSLRNKFDEIQAELIAEGPQIAIFTESWIESEDILAFEINGYTTFHRIRNRADKKKGGGISLYIDNSLTVLGIQLPSVSEVEAISIMCRSNYMPRNTPFFVFIAAYSPPKDINGSALLDFISAEVERILTINTMAAVFVLGDFNDLGIEHIFALKPFKQLVKDPTRGGNLLDRCFYKGSINYIAENKAPISTSDHCSLVFRCNQFFGTRTSQRTYFCRPKKKSNFDVLGRSLSSFDWSDILGINDIDLAAAKFSETLCMMYECAFPLEEKKTKGVNGWFSEELRKIIRERDRIFRQNRCDNNLIFLANRIKMKVKEAKKKEHQYLIENVTFGSADYYKIIKKCLGQPYISKDICFPGMGVDQSFLIMCDYFKKLANTKAKLEEAELTPYLPGLPLKHVDTWWVLRELNKLPFKSNASPDGLPSFILKSFSVELCEPIAGLINKSITQGVCPKVWKREMLVPIPKVKCVLDPGDVRLISLASNIAKICEKYIYSMMLPEILTTIDPCHFGGIPGRGTAQYLSLMVDDILSPLENNKCRTATIVTDFSKAFNRVDHNILINSLISMQPSPYIVKWLVWFLSDRQQVMNLHSSDDRIIFSCSNGIPQGSVLSALLFIVLSNDIGNEIPKRFKFMDDLSVICVGTPEVLEVQLQSNLQIIIDDSVDKGMEFNALKSCYLIHDFSKSKTPFVGKTDKVQLQEKSTCKILGLFVQSDLKWDRQIEEIISKASRKLFIIYRMKRAGSSRFVLLHLYKTFIRPNLEYCCVVWGGAITSRHISKIESVQTRVLRIILDKDFIDYNRALVTLGLESLATRRRNLSINFAIKFFKMFPSRCPPTNFAIHGINTRNAGKFHQQFIRTKRYKTSPIPYLYGLMNQTGAYL